ncbi:glycosyltransferase family 2 protein [Formosa algae]|uniref:glycosyltransferase family 2 protein n=1 Tax=Formosa algae TaxID=225843 RepID=UPI000CCF8EB4|nr:glycosyltransferase family 2 protein [Formosa algae]PNW26863.1 hypothetical protein BKP44_15395 [Formosa algae]
MKISVYIPSYNQKLLLKEAIDSVLNQTLQPFEIIIVDDCSEDGSQELIKSYAQKYPKIKYLFHTINTGVSKTRIDALNMVTGDYVTYVDGDDVFLPNKLALESQLIENGNYDIAFTNHMFVNQNNLDDVFRVWCQNKNQIPQPGNMFKEVFSRNYPHQTIFRSELINMAFLNKIGFYDENLKIYEDFDLKIRTSKLARINFSIEPTSKVRVLPNSLSKSKKELHLKSIEYIYEKNNKLLLDLDINDQNFILDSQRKFLDKLNPSKTVETHNIKTKLKQKVISLINKI